MILANIALFLITFLLTALLAPKPKLEDARAQNLEDSQFPRATQDAPIPLVLGTARVRAPNTQWYGDFIADPITERIRTGLFSKKTIITGYKYTLGLDLGLALGPVNLNKIYIDDKIVFDKPDEDLGSAYLQFNELSVGRKTSTNHYDLVALFGAKNIQCDGIKIEAQFISGYSSKYGATSQSSSLGVYFFAANGIEVPSTRVVVTNLTAGGGLLKLTASVPPQAVRMELRKYSVGMFPVYQTRLIYDQLLKFTYTGYQEFCAEIDEPELFGGEGEGGGWTGQFCYYPGTFTQSVDEYLEEKIGVGMVPGYRGVAHIVFHANDIGEQPNLKQMAFELSTFTSNLSVTCDDYGPVNTFDIEPAEAIAEIIMSKWRGLGKVSSNLNLDSFREAATTLRNEKNGVSVMVTSSQTGKDVVSEILRQIDGVLYEEPETNEINLKLIRNDYDIDTIPVYDEDDIIDVKSFTKSSWHDLYSQVRVSFSSRDSDSGKVASAQDMAVANQIGGLKTANLSFPFCYDKALANRIAARELSKLSTPIFRMSVEMKRSSYHLRPGAVFKINWPSFGLENVVLRVQKHDFGSLLDNRVILDCVQDIFAVSDVVMSPPEETAWVNDKASPGFITTHSVAELPEALFNVLSLPPSNGFESMVVFPRKPKTTSQRFSVVSGIAVGELDYLDPNKVPYPKSFLFSNDYPASAGFLTGLDSVGFDAYSFIGTKDPESPGIPNVTESMIRNKYDGIIYANGEWMAYENATTGGVRTISKVHRGLFGSSPVLHPADSVGYILTDEIIGDGSISAELESTDTFRYKILDTVGATTKSRSSVERTNYEVVKTNDRPLRPRNLKIDGSRDTSIKRSRVSTSVSWVASNRKNPTTTFENDAAETPDLAETYDVQVYQGSVLAPALGGTGVTSPFMVDFSSMSGSSTGEIRVYSRRTVGNLASSRYYAMIPFELQVEELLLSGDANVSGTEMLLLDGDVQTGTDVIYL